MFSRLHGEFWKGPIGWDCGSVGAHFPSMYETEGKEAETWMAVSVRGRAGRKGSSNMACFGIESGLQCVQSRMGSQERHVHLSLVGQLRQGICVSLRLLYMFLCV